jgi:hypothetical protein
LPSPFSTGLGDRRVDQGERRRRSGCTTEAHPGGSKDLQAPVPIIPGSHGLLVQGWLCRGTEASAVRRVSGIV